MYCKTTLKNGLRIITVPQQSSQTVTVLVLVGTGSKYEKKEINGISHFLEHVYFKGTKKRPTSLAVSETLDRIGGSFNAFTGEDYTGYYAKVAATNFGIALDWVSDIYLNSLLPKKEIENEKGVIIEEINMYLDTPIIYINEFWKKLLYGDQPAGWDVAGTKENVSRINREQISNYQKSHYTASNTIVCVAGKIKGQSAINEIKKYFSKISTSKPLDKVKVIERQTSPECLLLSKPTDQTHFCLGVRTHNLFHEFKYPLELIAVTLGGMMSSRLFAEIRDKLGLAYYIKTEADEDPDTGFLVTRAGVDNKRVEKAISAILKEYKKISQEKIPSSELKKAKENIKGRLSMSLEGSDVRAAFFGTQELLEGKILTPKEVYKEIDKVTVNDILKVAKDIFRPEKLNLALIGPFKDKEKFKKLLNEF